MKKLANILIREGERIKAMWRGKSLKLMPAYWAMIPVSIDTVLEGKSKNKMNIGPNTGQQF
jgi:hypothetical protein